MAVDPTERGVLLTGGQLLLAISLVERELAQRGADLPAGRANQAQAVVAGASTAELQELARRLEAALVAVWAG